MKAEHLAAYLALQWVENLVGLWELMLVENWVDQKADEMVDRKAAWMVALRGL